MIRRVKEPYRHMWNGLGGKIEGEETPTENILREMKEEAEIDLTQAERFSYAGVVSWKSTRKEGITHGGMYAYLAYFQDNACFENRETREGLLSWKELAWLCETQNTEVAENIRYFLPLMLRGEAAANYHCTYVFGKLTHFEKKRLEEEYSILI